MSELTAGEQALMAQWDQHLGAEFGARSAEAALATMVDAPTVLEVPVLLGGHGREQVGTFYARHFLNQLPPDLTMRPISRTIGQDRVVDELYISFTHSCQMDFVLPGVPATGKRVEMALVLVVQFRDGKVESEHLYWDQASVLVQVGLLERGPLPVVGGEGARQLIDPTGPMNQLLARAKAAE